jgi:hypothetical protein
MKTNTILLLISGFMLFLILIVPCSAAIFGSLPISYHKYNECDISGFKCSSYNFDYENIKQAINHLIANKIKVVYEAHKNIFKKIGIKQTIIIEKLRLESEKNNGFHLVLDNVKKLGLFVEIEAEKDRQLNEFLVKFSFPHKEIRFGYTNLYAERILKIKIPDFDKRYKEDSDWNYRGSQKNIVHDLINKN